MRLLYIFVITVSILIILSRVLRKSKLPKKSQSNTPPLSRSSKNPILKPIKEHSWESEAVFNPAALCINNRVHLLYRALGADGISRIGYASSNDGVNFDERLPLPVFTPEQHEMPRITPKKWRNPFTSPARQSYDREHNKSGGGWGGFEDPRAVVIEDQVHMTCSAFNGWSSVRMTLSSMPTNNFLAQLWSWSAPAYLSQSGIVHKNWVLFPEKIHGRYAILHSISPQIQVEYVDELPQEGEESGLPINSVYHPRPKDRQEHWDSWVRGAGPPPLRTDCGWLLFYHAIESSEPDRYKLGAILLDTNDPTKVLYRSSQPVLAPDMHYENDWKPGIVYATGAIIKDGTLFLYYGGGDKTISVATAPIDDFLNKLTHNDHAILTYPVV